jgi:Hypervirulence associated proteins TUDOR domain
MPKTFKIGNHVRWNSEAGRVSGDIIKKITSDMKFKGYVHHASREAPQYLMKSDKTEHVAIHKGTALRLIPTRARKSARTTAATGTTRKRKR